MEHDHLAVYRILLSLLHHTTLLTDHTVYDPKYDAWASFFGLRADQRLYRLFYDSFVRR